MAITDITKERALHIAGLVYDFNAKLSPYIVAELNLSYAASYVIIYYEYGKRGYGKIESFSTLPGQETFDEDLREAERKMKRLMEAKWDV